MRILGIDYGDVKIGVAISDELGWTAQGVTVIKRVGLKKDIAALKAIIDEYGGVEKIVIGMPYNMDGSEGERVELTRKFMEELDAALGIPIVEVDERWTSMEAEKLLIDADVSRGKRKGKVDIMAASLILQGYLDMNKV